MRKMCQLGDLVLGCFLFICALCDFKERRIPVLLLIFMNVVAVFFHCFSPKVNFVSAGVGVLIGILFLGISKWTKEAVGYGDSWLMLIFGIYLGGFRVLQLLLVASLLSGVVSLFGLCVLKWKRNNTLPFVPFMLVSYLGVMWI